MKRDTRSNFLDALRALAITLVVLAHWFPGKFPGASIGVSIFFALSGYLITKTLLDAEPRPSLRAFYVRRFMRIWPPYIVAIGLNFLAMLFDADHPFLNSFITAIPGYATFTTTPAIREMGTAVFWTLYIEFWFYLTIPLFLIAVRRQRARVIGLALIGCCSSGCLFYLSYHQALYAYLLHRGPINSVAWSTLLIFGSLVAIADQGLRATTIPSEAFSRISWLCFLLLLAIVFFASDSERTLVWPMEATIASAITAIWIFVWRRSHVDLANSPVIFIGRISYSIYLIHAIPLGFFNQIRWPETGALALSKTWAFITCIVLAATVMHYLIERPAMRLGRKLAKTLVAAGPAKAVIVSETPA